MTPTRFPQTSPTASIRPRWRGSFVTALLAVLGGCTSEYDLVFIGDPLPGCQSGCDVTLNDFWINGQPGARAGHDVALLAFGRAPLEPVGGGGLVGTPTLGGTVDKKYRSAAAGAPEDGQGTVSIKRVNRFAGTFKPAAAQVLPAPELDTEEFGFVVEATDIREGHATLTAPLVEGGTFVNIAYGEELVVGAPGTNDQIGEIYWYEVGDGMTGAWSLAGSLVPATAVSGDRFGSAIATPKHLDALYPDEIVTVAPPWIAVGAPGGGDVYILEVTPGSVAPLTEVQLIHRGGAGQFGAALAIDDFDGDGLLDLAVGEPAATGGGRVWLYRGTGVGVEPVAALSVTGMAGAAAFGTAMDSGFFRLDNLAVPGLAVGDPGHSEPGAAQTGAVCLFQFGVDAMGDLVVDSTDCGAFPDAIPGAQWGASVAVGNFSAQNATGGTTGVCAVGEEVAVGAPGAEIPMPLGMPSPWPDQGRVDIVAQDDDGPNLAIPAFRTWWGLAAGHELGTAIDPEYVQRSIHEDLLMGSAGRNADAGGMTLSIAMPTGGLNDDISGRWLSADSNGNPFDLSFAWDGTSLDVRMLSEVRIKMVDASGAVCQYAGNDISFRGAHPISDVPWTTVGVDHTEYVSFDLASDLPGAVVALLNLPGMPGTVIEGTLSYSAVDHEFTIELDENAGPLQLVSGCTVPGNPFVFHQTLAYSCDM